MRLWDKGKELDDFILEFTVGEDPIHDTELLPYDVEVTRAHALALKEAGIFTEEEYEAVLRALDELKDMYRAGKVKVKVEDEDSHTVIENFLVERIGDTGKKIHTGKSRNDQVLTALRLYYLDRLEDIRKSLESLVKSVENFSENHGRVAFAGLTHTRWAMPTDFGTWSGALIESLKDDLALLKVVEDFMSRSPLGTGAGYGVPIDLDRELMAKELGFSSVQVNPIHVQMSRGKYEYLLVHVLSQITFDLNRFASDIIFLSLFGCLNLPEELTTGSSMMPHKKNPDVLELVRAYHHGVVSRSHEVISLVSNLIMGYHRDMQLLKKPVFESIDIVGKCLKAMDIVFNGISVNEKKCQETITDEVVSTHRVYELVKRGIPFREAYRMVADDMKKL